MKIKKILNNNAIIAEENGHEIMAMGRGLAFRRCIGMDVSREYAEKIFVLSGDLQGRFEMLLRDIPTEYIDAAADVFRLAENALGKINDEEFLALTDHIHMAIERLKQNQNIRNMMRWEIKRFYPKEFNVAKEAAELLSKKFHVNVPEDETGFIAMHFIDAQLKFEQPMADKALHLIQEMMEIIRLVGHVTLDHESHAYYRLVTHLKFLARRILTRQISQKSIDVEMILLMQKKYPRAWHCTEEITRFLQKQYDYQVSADDEFYLLVHLARIEV